MRIRVHRRWKYLKKSRKDEQAHLVPDWGAACWLEAKCGKMGTSWTPLLQKWGRVGDYAEELFCKKCLGNRKLPHVLPR